MKRSGIFIILLASGLLVGWLGGASLGFASPLMQPAYKSGAPTLVSYQGQIKLEGVLYNGTGYFKFAIIDAAPDSFWSNDGSSVMGGEPDKSVILSISNGLFNVLLGDPNLGMVELRASAFDGTERYLRIWFSNDDTKYTRLEPDQRIAAVPYALQAEEAREAGNADALNGYYAGNGNGNVAINNGTINSNLNADKLDNNHAGNASGNIAMNNGTVNINLNADMLDNYHAGNASGNIPLSNGTLNTNLNADKLDGLHASEFVQGYQNMVVVAKSGGDYTSIHAALAAITATTYNRYLIKVMPGIYEDFVVMEPFVDIEGSGELNTRISLPYFAYITATVMGASNAELRFLTVERMADLYFPEGAVAIFNKSASPRITHVTAIAKRGATNCGIKNVNNSSPLITASIISATNDTYLSTFSYGICNTDSSPTLNDVTIQATGIYTNAGIYNTSSIINMTNVSAHAFNGSKNYAVYNKEGLATIQSSILRADQGTYNYGIYNIADWESYIILNNSQLIVDGPTIYNSLYGYVRVGASLLDGGAVMNSGSLVCYACYDEYYTNAGGVGVCP